jgi:hypothetical protein
VIGSLEDAWKWYRSVRELTRSMARLGGAYWADLPWDGPLGRDTRLRDLNPSEILDKATAVLGDIDDLCVLLLFSVFEADCRAHALADVAAELPDAKHPALKQAVKTMNESIESGSFFRILEAYKGLDANLVEEVNQVRRDRNWVAHGRRGERPAAVNPQTAFDQLGRFLDRIVALPT